MEINYPVFKVGIEKPTVQDKVMLYLRQYRDEDDKPYHRYLIIDDKNIDKPTLGERRLELFKENIKLKPLGTAVFFIGDLIKLATKRTWFIDNEGKLFQYKKTKSVPLIFRKITLQIDIPSGGAVLEVEGIPSRFKTLYTPRLEEKYAGILVDGFKYILYGVYDYLPEAKTRRMI